MITAFIFIICLFISIVVGPIFFISGLLLLKKYNKNKWFEVDGVIVKRK